MTNSVRDSLNVAAELVARLEKTSRRKAANTSPPVPAEVVMGGGEMMMPPAGQATDATAMAAMQGGMPPGGMPPGGMPPGGMPPGGGMPVDPATGLPIDPATGMPVDPNTGMPIDPATGMPIDPMSGMPIDPSTGQPVPPPQGAPMPPEAGPPPGDPAAVGADPLMMKFDEMLVEMRQTNQMLTLLAGHSLGMKSKELNTLTGDRPSLLETEKAGASEDNDLHDLAYDGFYTAEGSSGVSAAPKKITDLASQFKEAASKFEAHRLIAQARASR